MDIFLTGATGYIGGSVAAGLLKAGHRVTGLARDERKAEVLRAAGIVAVLGSLDDADLLAEQARAADAVINAADANHRGSAEAFLDALAGTGKPYLHTSGAGVLADKAHGAVSSAVFDEDTEFTPEPEKAARAELDRFVVDAAARGVRSVVVCPPLIYGHGLGASRDSYQVPRLVELARRDGVARHVGEGANTWSTVHVEDLVALYLLALDEAPAGTFLFAENGEASFLDIARTIGSALGLGEETRPLDFAEAVELWGEGAATFTMSSNARVRANRARALGWRPEHGSLLDWIRAEVH
jgi:nucleoside-diphosphate-sugar epimerase